MVVFGEKKKRIKLGAATDRPHTTHTSPPSGMTGYPAPETHSHHEFRLLMENLSNQLRTKPVSDSRYASLVGFQPDDELQMTGTFKLA